MRQEGAEIKVASAETQKTGRNRENNWRPPFVAGDFKGDCGAWDGQESPEEPVSAMEIILIHEKDEARESTALSKLNIRKEHLWFILVR